MIIAMGFTRPQAIKALQATVSIALSLDFALFKTRKGVTAKTSILISLKWTIDLILAFVG